MDDKTLCYQSDAVRQGKKSP